MVNPPAMKKLVASVRSVEWPDIAFGCMSVIGAVALAQHLWFRPNPSARLGALATVAFFVLANVLGLWARLGRGMQAGIPSKAPTWLTSGWFAVILLIFCGGFGTALLLLAVLDDEA